jgi:hypothetical protein
VSAVNEALRGRGGTVMPFERLMARNVAKPTMKIFPNDQHELLNSTLDHLELKFDREGQRRTACDTPTSACG